MRATVAPRFLFACAVLLLCGLLTHNASASSSDSSCKDVQAGRRIIVPGAWEPPPGTDSLQWIGLTANSSFRVLSAGSVSIANQLNRWDFTFTIQNFDISWMSLHFQSGSSIFNDYRYLTIRVDDFVVTEAHPNETERALFPDVISFPLAHQPIVFTYNYTGLWNFVVNATRDSVYMDIETLADIYLGKITSWNDSRILALNPTLAAILPHQEIIPIGYAGSIETSTLAVSEAFYRHSKRFRKAFPGGPFKFWPVGDKHLNPKLVLVNGAYSTFAYTLNTAGGIGYMPYQVMHTSSASGNAPYIIFRDDEGNPVIPSEEHVMKPYKHADMNRHNDLIYVDYNISSAWPVTSDVYMHINTNNNYSERMCTPKGHGILSKDRLMMEYIRWLYTDSTASKQGSASGIFMTPSHIREGVVEILDDMTCYKDNKPILRIEVINDHSKAYFEGLLGFSIGISVLTLILCLVLAFMKDEKGEPPNKIALLYSILLVFGALLVYLSIIFFYLVPDERWVCQTRVWLFCIGSTIFLGAVFSRTFQIHLIHRMAHSRKAFSNNVRRRKSIYNFVISVGLSLAAQLVILIVQVIVDPLKSVLSEIDEVERTASWVCKCDTWVWVGIEIGFFMIMLAYGGYVVYKTWDIKDRFSEGKWILMSVYNIFIAMVVMVAIAANIEVKDDTIFIMATTGILFSVTTTMLLTHVPKFGSKIESCIFKMRSEDSTFASRTSRSATQTQSASHANNTNSGNADSK